jgi:hypothetical protein
VPRRLLLSAAGIALTIALAGAGCADETSPAVQVGDTTITHDELMTELEEWSGNTATQASQALPQSGTPHGYAAAPASQLIGERILLALFEEEFVDRGLEVTDEDRANAYVLMGIDPSQEEQILGGFSDAYRAEYLERWAKVAAVQAETGSEEELRALIDERSKDVELSSRYGTWDQAGFAVTPPSGPVQAGGLPADADLDPAAP